MQDCQIRRAYNFLFLMILRLMQNIFLCLFKDLPISTFASDSWLSKKRVLTKLDGNTSFDKFLEITVSAFSDVMLLFSMVWSHFLPILSEAIGLTGILISRL